MRDNGSAPGLGEPGISTSRHFTLDDELAADPKTGRIASSSWELHASWIHSNGKQWIALIKVRENLALLVTSAHPDDVARSRAQGVPPNLQMGQWRGKMRVEAWIGDPEFSEGVAVLGMGSRPQSIAPIRLCSCGSRGCANSGRQLNRLIWPSQLREVVDTLRSLPWAKTEPDRDNVVRGGLMGLLDVEERTREEEAVHQFLRAHPLPPEAKKFHDPVDRGAREEQARHQREAEKQLRNEALSINPASAAVFDEPTGCRLKIYVALESEEDSIEVTSERITLRLATPLRGHRSWRQVERVLARLLGVGSGDVSVEDGWVPGVLVVAFQDLGRRAVFERLTPYACGPLDLRP